MSLLLSPLSLFLQFSIISQFLSSIRCIDQLICLFHSRLNEITVSRPQDKKSTARGKASCIFLLIPRKKIVVTLAQPVPTLTQASPTLSFSFTAHSLSACLPSHLHFSSRSASTSTTTAITSTVFYNRHQDLTINSRII